MADLQKLLEQYLEVFQPMALFRIDETPNGMVFREQNDSKQVTLVEDIYGESKPIAKFKWDLVIEGKEIVLQVEDVKYFIEQYIEFPEKFLVRTEKGEKKSLTKIGSDSFKRILEREFK